MIGDGRVVGPLQRPRVRGAQQVQLPLQLAADDGRPLGQPDVLLVARHQQPRPGGEHGRLGDDVEEELGGVAQLLLDVGRVDDVDDAAHGALVVVDVLLAQALVAGHVHQDEAGLSGRLVIT